MTVSDIEIVDRPELKTPALKLGEFGFTTMIWTVWIYLFLPIVNILLVIVAGYYFYSEVIDEANYQRFLDLCVNIGWCVISLMVVFIGWGRYNYHRFGKRCRRKDQGNTDVTEMANFFKRDVYEILELQKQKEIHQ